MTNRRRIVNVARMIRRLARVQGLRLSLPESVRAARARLWSEAECELALRRVGIEPTRMVRCGLCDDVVAVIYDIDGSPAIELRYMCRCSREWGRRSELI